MRKSYPEFQMPPAHSPHTLPIIQNRTCAICSEPSRPHEHSRDHSGTWIWNYWAQIAKLFRQTHRPRQSAITNSANELLMNYCNSAPIAGPLQTLLMADYKKWNTNLKTFSPNSPPTLIDYSQAKSNGHYKPSLIPDYNSGTKGVMDTDIMC